MSGDPVDRDLGLGGNNKVDLVVTAQSVKRVNDSF